MEGPTIRHMIQEYFLSKFTHIESFTEGALFLLVPIIVSLWVIVHKKNIHYKWTIWIVILLMLSQASFAIIFDNEILNWIMGVVTALSILLMVIVLEEKHKEEKHKELQ